MSAWDFLTPEMLKGGPRRVVVAPEPDVICRLTQYPPFHARIPYLDGPTDQEVEAASGWLRWMLDDPRRVGDPGQEPGIPG